MKATDSKLLEVALRIALEAHSGAKDMGGAPYILHPVRLMMAMETDTARMAALLHDVIEDCPAWTFARLRREGIPARVIAAVRLLTKREDKRRRSRREKDAAYFRYLRRLARDPVAAAVKMADLRDNLDVRRLRQVRPKDLRRLARYRKALVWLKSVSVNGFRNPKSKGAP